VPIVTALSKRSVPPALLSLARFNPPLGLRYAHPLSGGYPPASWFMPLRGFRPYRVSKDMAEYKSLTQVILGLRRNKHSTQTRVKQ